MQTKAMGHANLPEGITKLNELNDIIIRKMYDKLGSYKYIIGDPHDKPIMFAVEQSDNPDSCSEECCFVCCCFNNRPLVYELKDSDHRPIMNFIRLFRCPCSDIWCCCLQRMIVTTPLDMKLGEVQQRLSIGRSYTVRDGAGTVICQLENDWDSFNYTKDGRTLGRLRNTTQIIEQNKLINGLLGETRLKCTHELKCLNLKTK